MGVSQHVLQIGPATGRSPLGNDRTPLNLESWEVIYRPPQVMDRPPHMSQVPRSIAIQAIMEIVLISNIFSRSHSLFFGGD